MISILSIDFSFLYSKSQEEKKKNQSSFYFTVFGINSILADKIEEIKMYLSN
jgi:hypothetical protein